MFDLLFGGTSLPRKKAASTDTDTKRYLAVVPSLIQQPQPSALKRIEKRFAITIPYHITKEQEIFIVVNESQRRLSPLIRHEIPQNILSRDLFDNINNSVKQSMSSLIGMSWNGVDEESVFDVEYLTNSHFLVSSNEAQVKLYVTMVPYLANTKVNKDILNILALNDNIKFNSSFSLSPIFLPFDDLRHHFLHEISDSDESFSYLGCLLDDELHNLCSKTLFLSEINNHFGLVLQGLVDSTNHTSNHVSNSNLNYYDIMNNITSGSLPLNSEIIIKATDYYSPITLSSEEISNFGINAQPMRTNKSTIRSRQDNHTKYILPKSTNSLSKDFYNTVN